MRARKGTRLLVILLLIFISCDSSEHELEIEIINPVNIEENAMINCILEDLLNEVEHNVISAENGLSVKLITKQDSFPIVRISMDESQNRLQSISIDYGNINQKDFLGREKRGIIFTQITGRYMINQCIQTIWFENFYLNDLKVTGKIEVCTLGYNQNDCLCFSVSYQELKFETAEKNTYSISGTKTREWIQGIDTPNNPWDDYFLITGECHGTNSEKREYDFKISTPLLITPSCEFILEGDVEFEIDSEKTTYQYGNGMCDNKGYYLKDGAIKNFEFGSYTFRYNK